MDPRARLLLATIIGGALALLIIGSVFLLPHTPSSSNPLKFFGEIASSTTAALVPPSTSEYLEVVDGCEPDFSGGCALARSAPATSSPILAQLRNGMVLKITDTLKKDGLTWYKVTFDEWLRYPERAQNDWYVASNAVKVVPDLLEEESIVTVQASTTKRIIVDRSDQMLYAYEGDILFMQEPVSTGLELTPTPRGTFSVFRKTPSRYMQGPLPGISDQYYDLPGVPWNLYFTEQGAVIHGAYWHNHFGEPWSHGCVNLPVDKAHELYDWAPIGTKVIVRD